MSRHTTTRNLIGPIGGLAIVGVSTGGALNLTEIGADAPGTAVVAVPTAGSSSATRSSSGVTTVQTTEAVAADITADDATTTDATGATATGATTTEATTTATTEATSEHADGSYTATGGYSTPGGTETVTVIVALADDVVTSGPATGSACGGTWSQFQSAFLSAYSPEVVGTNIDDLPPFRIAGSSLTSLGFNSAIEEIRTDAQS